MCGLKQSNELIDLKSKVTPCVGVWIETIGYLILLPYLLSHPAWVCGLKRSSSLTCTSSAVTPCVGVWIETFLIMTYNILIESHPAWVCGLKPAIGVFVDAAKTSHPAWVCGLKRYNLPIFTPSARHTLRGCVD